MHLDDTLREMAMSDIAVSTRLRRMKEGFYGRISAYEAALDSGSGAGLAAALMRNVYGGVGSVASADALAVYVASLDAALAAIPLEDFATGRFRFPEGRIGAGG